MTTLAKSIPGTQGPGPARNAPRRETSALDLARHASEPQVL